MLPKAVRMLRRVEFVQASRRARAVATPFFIVQSLPDSAPNLSRRTNSAPDSATNSAPDSTRDSMVLGITASRKVGNAVARNRAKRRLRALLYQNFRPNFRQTSTNAPSRRIVLIARKACLDANFASMRQHLEQALRRSKARIS